MKAAWIDILKEYNGKKVLVTGITGFKGSWMCRILNMLGARVYGYALAPESELSLYNIAGIGEASETTIADIRDYARLDETIKTINPDIIFHLAAQPLVIESYKRPRDTFDINVMGTVNLLDAISGTDSVKSVVNITTDKVYENREWIWGYREDEKLNGFDPYSNSKSCSELVTGSYINSFFRERKLPVSTVRAGNVIGGGDFSENRIIPDCIKAALKSESVIIRNPDSTRPYQHVIEPLMAYLLIGIRQMSDYSLSGAYNVGPDENSCVTTGRLVERFCSIWGKNASYEFAEGYNGCHEANFLKLDCSKLKSVFGWNPVWDIDGALTNTIEWTKAWVNGSDMKLVMDDQINNYMEMGK